VTDVDPPVHTLVWWRVLLVCLVLWFGFPQLVQLIAGAPAAKQGTFLEHQQLGEPGFAYGTHLSSVLLREATWEGGALNVQLLTSPWARQFVPRFLVLLVVISAVGYRLLPRAAATTALHDGGRPVGQLWLGWTLALAPWLYLIWSAGGRFGYGALVAVIIDAWSYSAAPDQRPLAIPDWTPGAERLVALAAFVTLLLVTARCFSRVEGGHPTLARVLGLDLAPRDPGRILHDLPHLGPNQPVAATSPNGGASFSAQDD